MDNEQTCSNCRFRYGRGTRPRGFAACHRNPPVVALSSGLPKWPMTDETDWCGEWRRQAESANISADHTLHGCICPPTAERTCQRPMCPRRGLGELR